MGGAKLNRFTNALAALCKERLLAEKWILSPSLRVGHQWLDSITRSGQAVVNARIKTLKGMALDLAGPEMARSGVALVSDRGAAILIDRILNLLRSESPTYVTKMAPSPTLSQSVYSSIKDIRLAGLGPEDLVSHHFEHPDKASELSLILSEYLSVLRHSHLIDYADALDMAPGGLVNILAESDDVFVVMPEDFEFTAKEDALIRAVPDERRLVIPVDQPLTDIEGHSGPFTNSDMLRWLPDPAQAPAPDSSDETASLFSAVGEVNEINEVFRRVLSQGIPLDEVEILHTDRATYVPLTYEFCERLASDFPNAADPIVTFAEGIPATYSRPGRALKGWVSWVRGGFLQSTLVRMFDDRIISMPRTESDAPGFEDVCTLLRSLGIGFGRDRYLPKIDELIAGLERRMLTSVPAAEEENSYHFECVPGDCGEDLFATEPSPQISLFENEFVSRGSGQREAERLRTATLLRQIVAGLLDITPEDTVNPAEILDSSVKFLGSFARRSDELDGYALRSLLDEIRDMARYVTQENSDGLSLDVWQWLSELSGEVRVMGSGPRPGRVHVSSVLTGGHSGRSHLFIVGLDDGRFPGSGYQDPVVLDTERRKLSERLSTTVERLGAKLGGFYRLLSRHRGTVSLCYSCRNLIDDREMFPSPLVISAFRIISAMRQGDQRDLLQWLPPAASFAPDDPRKSVDAAEWWLSRLCPSDSVADPEGLISRHFPHLGRGIEAAKLRRGTGFTVFDGRILRPGAELDPASRSGPILSGSILETVGRCPLAYFFRYVLGIRLPDDCDIDPERWLDPLQFGNLLHEVFYTFVGEVVQDHWPPIFTDDIKRIKEIVSAAASKYRELYPPPSEDAFLDQLRELNSAAEVFLREEERTPGRNPEYLEVSIGMDSYDKGSDLDTRRPEPVKLTDGRTVRVRGRVDRIDRIGSSEYYSIVDYKTGSAAKYEDADPFRRGRVIQHALYTAVAGQVLKEKLGTKAEVSQFEYVFPGSGGQGLRLAYQQVDLSEFPGILQSMRNVLAEGSFLSTDDYKSDCRYCDYRLVCGDVEALSAASSAKLENSSDDGLKHIKELRNRE
jgi:ATP-dependent helicase/nuclease subunit B